MSNAQVIAATTATIRQLLLDGIPRRDDAIPSLTVSTVPLDRVGADMTQPVLNLFLYQTSQNGAWRNRAAEHARPGESPLPPVALDLHYLLTAYGPVDVQQGDFSQRVLGAAVSVLHDHPVLGSDEIVGALSRDPALSQVERVRIAALPMTVEEMSKLWTTFQTNYRLSIAYEASVVLIESDRIRKEPLPVIRRGDLNRGPVAVTSPQPSLYRAVPPNGQAAVRAGELLTLEGRFLDSSSLSVRVTSRLLDQPVVLVPEVGSTAEKLAVRLPPVTDPGVMSTWAPGFYAVTVVVKREGLRDLSSNAVPFALAPQIALSSLTPPAGTVTLTVLTSPRLRDGQQAQLLQGDTTLDEEQRVQPVDPAAPSESEFSLSGAAGESFVVRLRADGVDSIPVTATDPLQFDPNQRVVFQ
jgi:hypothetical protein